MRLDDERESENVEDLRGEGGGGGGGIGLPHVGIGTVLVAVVAGYFFNVNPLTILGLLSGGSAPVSDSAPAQQQPLAADDGMRRFVSKVLAETEDTWHDVFSEAGRTYRNPKLVLFSGATQTACGTGESAQGPFYCPGDEKVYIDLSFYQELRDRFRAPGEFAEAYVIAHEVGHHVQKLLGTFERVEAAQRRAGEAQANALSVRLELQADCFAGVWGKRADTAKHLLEPGEIEQALTAASAIGDDRLQKSARGYAVPETFTHGSSEQRVHWFTQGIQTGDMSRCDTFGAGARP
jgi:predicted metalloprotease